MLVRKLLFTLLVGFFGAPLSAQVVINEICSANGDIIYDPIYYNFSGWVELYNPGNTSVNIGGYYLSDDEFDKTKWRIPTGTTVAAKGFVVFWCDKKNNSNHTNFSLDSDGEDVVLSNSAGLVVDKIKFPQQYTNVSYGRLSDGGSSIGYMISPTQKVTNNPATGTERLENPNVSLKSGRYGAAQTLTISHITSGVEIRYTTDGSEPMPTSTLYSNSLSISKTLTLKAKAFKKDFLPSKAEVKTYFINEHAFSLPVVSISTKPDYLWNNTIGIYTDGTNGIVGNCRTTPFNWNQDWDRHAVLEYFDATGDKKFDQGVEIRIGGACSRGFAQKSFAIKADDKYGKNHIDEKLFENKTADSYGGFMYRNSGNDNNTIHFRDALMQRIAASQMDVDYMDYKPTIFYLNGEYWGIQNMREKIDGDYIESNYGIDKDDIDLIESNSLALEGSAAAYNSYLATLQSMNLSDPASFSFIDAHIDVQEFINYLTTEIYLCNTDWPGNNVKFWRQRSTNGKFRWILWDTDFGLGMYSNQSYPDHPTLDFATDPDNGAWPNPAWSTLHIRLLLQNPIFRERFIQTFTSAMSSTFSPQNFNEQITQFQNAIKTEMPFHKQRWGGTVGDWNYEIERAKSFIAARQPFMTQHLADFFGLNKSVQLNVFSTPSGAGTFQLNNNVSSPVVSGPYYKDMTYTVNAVAAPGYVFKNWKITKMDVTNISMINKGDVWKYFDQGSLPAADWMNPAFVDGSWSQGEAELGYGDGDEKTVVSFGGNTNNKFVTTYFRRTFSVDANDLAKMDNLHAAVNFDDGVVVYLNGIEVYRNNMPGGAIGYATYSQSGAPAENTFLSFSIDKNTLQAGDNVIAVEVHQVSGTSSDISFDFELSSTITGSTTESTSTAIEISDVAQTDITMEATFEPVTSISGIIINEIGASSSDVQDEFNEQEDWIELYNVSTSPVDIAGLFITDDLSKKTKYQIPVGVNNETLMAPKSYKVLWADDDIQQGALHLGIKLSADGEAVGLYQMVGGSPVVLDQVSFPAQPDNTSYARIPDITGPFVATSILTPGSENMFEVVTANEEDVNRLISVFPNPTTDEIHITSSIPVQEVFLHDIYGREMKRIEMNSLNGTLDFSSYPRGLYLLRLKTESASKTVKVVKK